MQPQTCEPIADVWCGHLDLRFEQRDGRTALTRRRHAGPLRVQRPFYPEGDGVCHVYLLHPPGGVVGGDQLTIEVTVEAGAHALLTTPAAAKFYRSHGAVARQMQQLQVADGAVLEWLPQESIVFDGAHAEVCTRVELAAEARFVGWEIVCLGRPGAGERFRRGALRQRLELWRAGLPVYVERARYREGAPALAAAWGLAGRAVSGSMLCTHADPQQVEQVRELFAGLAVDGLCSISRHDGVTVCRYLGEHVDEARHCFESAWQLLRPAVLQRTPCAPRIWAT